MKQLIPFLIMSVCAAMYFMYIKPELVTIDEKKAEYDKYQRAIDEIKDVATLRDELTTKYESIPPEDLAKLDSIIPAQFDPVVFANEINDLIRRHSLKVTGLRIEYQRNNVDGVTDSTQIGESKYRTILSSFNVTGDYDKLFAFLKELESSLRLLDITNLSIKNATPPSNEKNPKLEYIYEIRLKTYSLK